MAPAPANELVRLDSTDVRFSVRTLLIATVPVALIAIVARQFVLRLAPDQQARVAVAWAGWLTLVVAWTLFNAQRRIRVEKLAGRTIMRLSIYGMNPLWRVVSRYLLCGYLALSVPVMLLMIADRAAQVGSVAAALLAAVYPDAIFWAWLMAFSIALWWWGRDIRLSAAGVLWDKRFIRWSEVHERWDPDRDALTLHGPDQHGVELVCDVVISEKQRGEVEALLREKRQTTLTTAIGQPAAS